VTTDPHVDGSWTWLDDTHAHWRPQRYYVPGTRVTVDARIYGVQLGKADYGASDERTSFVIGAEHVSVADDVTHQVKVYFNGRLVRTMPTSMGQHTGTWVNGTYISFWTMRGTYTVIGHENPAIMSSASYGLPAEDGGYPPTPVYWSTKISTDGIYLHELDGTVGDQGHDDVSHGCLNLNHDNAEWFYTHSRVGDVVIVKNAGAPQIKLWQGGDWSVPWSTWLAGSALH
jgi:lipoprotein-anchoring transpeptidase ErfK/SrfK